MQNLIAKINLSLAFYKSISLIPLVVSAACAYFIFKYGVYTFSIAFWVKIITLTLIFLYLKEYKSKELYFYKNLGLGKKALWMFAISLDLLIYLALTISALTLYGKYT